MEALKDFLWRRRMTQAGFAHRMELTEEHVSRVMNGKTPITPVFKWRFFEVFGYDATREVFGEIDAPKGMAPIELPV